MKRRKQLSNTNVMCRPSEVQDVIVRASSMSTRELNAEVDRLITLALSSEGEERKQAEFQATEYAKIILRRGGTKREQ